MENREIDNISKKTFEYFGSDAQQRKLVEEVFELLKAWILFDVGLADIEDVIEEHSDVKFVLRGLKNGYEISDKEEQDVTEFKASRVEKRIKNGYYKKLNDIIQEQTTIYDYIDE